MKKIYFCRHGLSKMNVSGHMAGVTDTPLVKIGKEQAKKAGNKAKSLNIDLIVSSPLKRAHETAKIIAKEIDYPLDQIHTSKLLLERDFGDAEGHPYSPDLDLDGFSDVETVNSIIERAKLSLRWIESLPGNNVLIVSHGSFGRALRSVILKDHEFEGHGQLPNAEIIFWSN